MKKLMIILALIISASLLGIPLWVLRDYSGAPPGTPENEPVVRVLNKTTGKVTALPLEEYLVGVVAAEMPANFAPEALKAQAVAARTYTVRRMFRYGAKPADAHGNAEICTDPVHCQAWSGRDELKAKWGRVRYYINIAKIEQAVKMTEGQVITYNRALIEPVYHGSCGGHGTENSEDVWNNPVPYLRGVNCSSEYRVADQVLVKDFDQAQMVSLLQKAGMNAAPAAAAGGTLMAPLKKSPQGRLQEARVLGQVMTGARLRQVLGMTSTLLQWEAAGGKIRVTSIGKGHAVGLCQFGANGMALDGQDYRKIISHYYTGVQIQKLKY